MGTAFFGYAGTINKRIQAEWRVGMKALLTFAAVFTKMWLRKDTELLNKAN